MTRVPLVEEALTYSVIGAFYDVYNTLGFGFLEYLFKGHDLGTQRLDMLVDEKLVVETKSTYELHRAATRQVYNYLRATKLEVGLLLHFGPEPRVYRISSRKNPDPQSHNPVNPTHPNEPTE